MNVRKRPRLELELTTTTAASSTSSQSSSMATPIAGYSEADAEAEAEASNVMTSGLFLTTTTTTSSSSGGGDVNVNVNAGAQIFLTICGDENSNESQEYYAIDGSALTTHIKQEPDLDLHALLPTNLQLPTGCEIYLVKDTTIQQCNNSAATQATKLCNGNGNGNASSMASIKLEPDSASASNISHISNINKQPSTNSILFVSGGGNVATVATPTSNIVPESHPNPTNGYNVKLDAYKKRDDKRRATHNEVERRRRDKINCWIFKLKEMLPTEGNRYSYKAIDAAATEPPIDKVSSLKANLNNGRTPPNDSKSQILIKACDYIKSMQNEIDNLRERLGEAEDLRLSNEALRVELEALKQQQELQERFSNAGGGSFNVTLNSLNSSATSDLFEGIDTAPNLSTVSSINFTKRGLMIADYDE